MIFLLVIYNDLANWWEITYNNHGMIFKKVAVKCWLCEMQAVVSEAVEKSHRKNRQLVTCEMCLRCPWLILKLILMAAWADTIADTRSHTYTRIDKKEDEPSLTKHLVF